MNVPEVTHNSEAALLPQRHKQGELFLCDIADAVLKDDMASMEHPFFTLATKPDMTVRYYEHNGNSIEIAPSHLGLATIFDKDILIFAISQLMAGLKEGRDMGQVLTMSPRDALVFTNRGTGGREYALLDKTLKRLSGTRIKTNIKTGGQTYSDYFGMVDSAHIQRDDETGKVIALRIKLSDWLYRSIQANAVLTLHPDYFRLRKPLERRIYELVRKHCGHQPTWTVGLDTLHKKSGSSLTLRKFRMMMREIEKTQHLPEYDIAVSQHSVTFTNSAERDAPPPRSISERVHLKPETYEKAREIGGGYDKYFLESEWRAFIDKKGSNPNHPDKAFLGFVKTYVANHGKA